MKKSLLFSVPILIITVLLLMLCVTGIKAHIALSVVGLVILVAHTIVTKKEWKYPALEILKRVMYAVALISGIAIMNVHGIALISIIHKISAVLFAVLLIGPEVLRVIKK